MHKKCGCKHVKVGRYDMEMTCKKHSTLGRYGDEYDEVVAYAEDEKAVPAAPKPSPEKPMRWRLFVRRSMSEDTFDVSSPMMAYRVMTGVDGETARGQSRPRFTLKSRRVGERSWKNWSCKACCGDVLGCSCIRKGE